MRISFMSTGWKNAEIPIMKGLVVIFTGIVLCLSAQSSVVYGGTEGFQNTFYGYDAGISTTNVGTGNTFIGMAAGMYNSQGGWNTCVGDGAGASSTTGSGNTFIGKGAGYSNTGSANVSIGMEAGYSTTGDDNVSIGWEAGRFNTTGSGNVFLGYSAGSAETNSDRLYIDNCYVKDGSGNCTIPLIYGEFDRRLVKINGTIQTTAGIKFPDGTLQTTAMIGSVGATNDDVYLGNWAGSNTSSGTENTFIGNNAGASNVSGSSNTMIGYGAGDSSLSGDSYNTYIGQQAGNQGSNNVIIGYEAGHLETGGGNVMIGYEAGYNETGGNKLYIANSSTTTPLIYGDFSKAALTVNGTLTMASSASASDVRYKKDILPLESSLAKVMKLKGVSYAWKTEDYKDKGFTDGRQIGFIAQEVEKVLPELVQTNSEGYKALSYDKVVPVLVEAIKEQQKEIVEQKAEAKEKDTRIEKLEKALANMERKMAALESLPKTVALK